MLVVNGDVASQDVRAKIEGIRRNLPEDIESPVVAKFDPAAMPILVAPTAFLEQPDPAIRLRHVPRQAQRISPPRAVMSNSFAFGGNNVSVLMRSV